MNNNNNSNNGKDDRGGARAFKRVKVRDARSLRSQPADAALKDGELDLQAFLNARQFEIRALEDGMRSSKALNNRRAFQLVPRGMRRRTASHNVKKLPKRLRRRARGEQLQDNTPTVVAGKRKPRTTRARIRVETAKRLGVLAEKKRKRKLREAKAKAKEGGGEGGCCCGGESALCDEAVDRDQAGEAQDPQEYPERPAQAQGKIQKTPDRQDVAAHASMAREEGKDDPSQGATVAVCHPLDAE